MHMLKTVCYETLEHLLHVNNTDSWEERKMKQKQSVQIKE